MVNFRKFTTASGAKIILGRDENSNDKLMKEFKGKGNTILHTAAPGSPFCVIDDLKPTNKDLVASGAICAGYSQDWRDNKQDTKVHVFTGKDIYKRKGMKIGTFGVRKFKKIKVKKKDIEKWEK